MAVLFTGNIFVASAQAAVSTPIKGAPATAAYTADEAAVLARRSGRPIEVTSALTPTDSMTANPDGTVTTKRHLVPIRKRVGGTWRSLDATLRANADGSVSPALSTSDLSFSGGGNGPLAIMRNAGKKLALSAPMTLPKPVLMGSTATYVNVLAGVDLQVTASIQGGFSQLFVVHDATAAANPALRTLKMDTVVDGVTVSTEASGMIAAKDKLGAAVFIAAAPVMWDSRQGAAGAKALGAPVPEGLAPIGVKVRAGAIELTPDAALLNGPGTVYPLFIDPTWVPVLPTTGGVRNGYASVAKAFPTSSKWNNTADPNPDNLQLGWANTPWHARTMVNFALDLGKLNGANLIEAHIDATGVYSGSCTATKTRVFAPATTLNSGNATWDNWYNNIPLGNEVGSATFRGGYSGCTAPTPVSFPVLPGIQGAVAGGRSTQTFVFTGDTNETSDTASYKELSLASLALQITYNHAPAKPANLTTSPQTSCTGAVSTVGDGDVMLYAPVSDPDNTVVGVKYEVWKSSTPGTLIRSTDPQNTPYGSGTTAVLTVPQADLRSAAVGAVTEFSWRVQIQDGWDANFLTSPWSDTCKFKFDPTRPGAPGATAPAEGATHIGQPVVIPVTKPAGAAIPAKYLYQLNAGAPGTVNADGSGNSSVTVTPTRRTNTLTITAVSSGGNVGVDSAVLTFTTAPLTTMAKDGDFTGDGIVDLVSVGGGTQGLPSGVWLARGQNNGQVVTDPANIGVNGNGVEGDMKPSNFDGKKIITGAFFGTGMQDLVAYDPGTGRGSIIAGNGDGSALLPQYSGNQQTIPDTELRDEGVAPQQLAAAGDSIGNGDNTSDLIGVGGPAVSRHLNYYFYASPRNQQGIIALTTPTPAGDMNWDLWTITTAQTSTGTSMFLWKKSTGALHLWRNLDVSSGDLVFQPFQLRASGWNTNADLSLQAADINGDNTVDLWTVGIGRAVTAHLTSGLSGTTGATTAQSGQFLNTATHSWNLNDMPSGAANGSAITTAADNNPAGTTARPLTGNAGATWHTGDLFSPDAQLNGATGTLTATAVFNTNADFSVSAWVKPSGGGTVLSQDGVNTAGFRLWLDTSTMSWRFGIPEVDSVGAPNNAFSPAGSAKMGVWTLLTGTYKHSTGVFNLSVNGVIVGSAFRTNSFNATGVLRVGANRNSSSAIGDYFSGQIARVQVWDSNIDPAAAFTVKDYSNQVLGGNLRDVSRDGKADMVAQRSTGDIVLYRSTGLVGPGAYDSGIVICAGCGMYDSANIADLNNDGKIDLFVREKSNGDMWYYPNSSTTATPVYGNRLILCQGCPDYVEPDVDDATNDGKTDLLVKQNSTGNIYVYPGVGAAGSVTWGAPILACGICTGFERAMIQDVNNDGTGDLVVREVSGKNIKVYPNTAGPGGMSWGAPILLCGGCGVFDSYTFGDANYDGKTDLVVHRSDTNRVIVYEGTAPIGSVTWGGTFYN